ncbi:hypothetical protein L2E82_22694 [Cichorium intybus]|uniref:Uncharacterized protein n=1 Tax=Cichorium intybus TaxID=13427 RepID=A0ACB9DY41_CICIN|nr:hypothetical protein L2E82_22694 [Cichorium intybus]
MYKSPKIGITCRKQERRRKGLIGRDNLGPVVRDSRVSITWQQDEQANLKRNNFVVEGRPWRCSVEVSGGRRQVAKDDLRLIQFLRDACVYGSKSGVKILRT